MYGTKKYGHAQQSRWLAVVSLALFSLSTSLVRTLDRAQEPSKEAPSAQVTAQDTETMGPEIPLSWEINYGYDT